MRNSRVPHEQCQPHPATCLGGGGGGVQLISNYMVFVIALCIFIA